MNLFKILDKEKCVALNLSIDKNCAVLCTVAEAQINNAFKYCTLKLIVSGSAVYKVNRRPYKLLQNEYLLFNGGQEGVGIIDSKKDVSQFCIHLKPSFITGAYQAFTAKDGFDIGKPVDEYPDFRLFENIYHVNNSLAFSKQLKPLVAMINEGRVNDIVLNEEWLLNLTGAIVLNEKNIRSSLKGLDAVKPATRNEIMKRLLTGKDYMDTYFTNNPMVADIARFALMSEFFFYRNFKLAFKTTPYQYILDKKIALATVLMHNNNMALGEIAATCGFPDIYTFSKAFKRKYGFAPSKAKEGDRVLCN